MSFNDRPESGKMKSLKFNKMIKAIIVEDEKLARDLIRERSDLNEIAVWEDGVHVVDDHLYYYQAIHQESDVVPENIDCIRAMFKLTEDNMESIKKTNTALGIQ